MAIAGTGTDAQVTSAFESFQRAINLSDQAKRGLADNKAKLIGLANRIKTIKDPTTRAKLTAKLNDQVAQQVAVQNFYNDASKKLADFNAFLQDFLAKAGFIGPSPGLGFLPALPAVWVAVLVAAGVALTAVITANTLHAGAIADTSRIVDAMLKGQISPDAAAKGIEALNEQAKNQTDALGIKSAVQAVMPVLLIVLGIVVLPQILSVARTLRPARAA